MKSEVDILSDKLDRGEIGDVDGAFLDCLFDLDNRIKKLEENKE